MMKLKGKAHKFGNNINTDEIIPAKYLNTTDLKELGEHCMEGIREGFARKVQKGDIIAGGSNFGCGSSREHAPLAIKGCGVSSVIAESFARIFFRNSINIGLPILECREAKKIREGDSLEIDLSKGEIKNLTRNKTYHAQPFPVFMQELVNAGGLMNQIRKRRTKT